MVLIVVVVFALLAGFFITSLQSLEPAPIPTALTLSVAPSPTPPPSPLPATSTPIPEEGIWLHVRAARLFDQIAHQVETRRALSPRTEVPLSFLDEQEMKETLQRFYTEDDPETTLLPFTILGMLPDTPAQIQAQTPAGIYVAEQQQLYVSTNHSEDDRNAQVLLAHAYVHALQDQHFDLEGMQARAATTDQRLAAQALIEGDATLATALYSREGDLSLDDWERLTDLIVEAEQPRQSHALASCEAWNRLQRFPYQEGRAFASAIFEHGGWDAVNRCYTNLPHSTQQILHPSRYLGLGSSDGQPDQPSVVIVPDIGPSLGEKWELMLEDTLGELTVGLFLSQVTAEERAWQIAKAWDGDTFVAWERTDGRRIVIWRIIWKTNTVASDYERELTSRIIQRHAPVRPISSPLGLPGQWWETDAGTVHVHRTARHVLLVRAPDTNTAVNVVRELP